MRLITAVLFLGVFFYFWISLTPFPDPNAPSLTTPYGGTSNRLNQIVVLLMSATLLFAVLGKASRVLLMRPYSLLAAILVWYLFASLFAGDPGSAFRRIIFTALVCMCSSAILLLPRSREQFANLIMIGVLAVLGIAYFGIIAKPHLAIHQATDALEQLLAGDWRGHLGHKNAAAAAMVFSIFIGLFVMRTRSSLIGAAIVVLAAVFLWKSGSKTSAAMLPVVLIIAWIFERSRVLGAVVFVGLLVCVNTILMSAAASPAVQKLLFQIGIDPTFTDRTSIWQVAQLAIAQSPVVGYGFQSFWQTDALFRSGYSLLTWAVTAANSHNGYVEQLINGGVPALLLSLIWLVFLPISYAGKAIQSTNDATLTRLFLRIWLYSLLLGCLESPFFGTYGPIWFTMVMGIFGLRMQAYGTLLEEEPRTHAKAVQSPTAANAR